MTKRQLLKLLKKLPLMGKVRLKYTLIRNRILRFYWGTLVVNKKTVFFESYLANSYACSPRAIYENMLNDPRFHDYQFVWAFRDTTKYKHLLKKGKTSLVQYRTPGYYRELAKSKYWIVNGWIPTLLEKKPSQIMVQTWHGTPLKRLRNDLIPNTKHATLTYEKQVAANKIDTARYDFFISPSRFASEKFISAFNLKGLNKEDIIIETGYPRNDFLFTYSQADVSRVRKSLGIPGDKKVILYAPTWRDDQHKKGKGFTYNIELDFDNLRTKFSGEYVILFRAHYNIASQFDFGAYDGFVYDVSSVDDVNNLYIISDVLITDYSSVFFDYANLERPIIFYMYDLEYYENELRGFYIDTKELPGPIVKTNSQLVNKISNLHNVSKEYAERYRQFRAKYNYLDDEHSSERVIEEVFK